MLAKQLEAFEKFSKLKVGALFMQMGTGKTRIAVELVNYNKVDLLIYVCPFSTKNNVEDELHKWGLECPYLLVAYETIQASDKAFLSALEACSGKRCFIIADESIFIKNDETKRFKRIMQLRNRCEYALILNGTPLTKNEWDLYNQMYFLSPLILNMNRSDFLNIFFTLVRYKKKGKKENQFYKFSEVNAEYLYKLIEPYIFKSDLEFAKNESECSIWVDYEGEEYQENKMKSLDIIKEGRCGSEAVINMLTSLLQIANSYNKKNNMVADYANGRKCIVYCTYLEEVRQINEHIDCFVITGDTKNRDEIIKSFKRSNKPLLMTYGVGSYSLNLQFCNEIVFSSINFDYGKVEQAKHRIKRIGQERDISYTYFLTRLGITNVALESLCRKKSLKELLEEKITKGEEIYEICKSSL